VRVSVDLEGGAAGCLHASDLDSPHRLPERSGDLRSSSRLPL
jgi:hypothetical protein